MLSSLDRRDFLRLGASAGVVACTSVAAGQPSVQDKLVVGIMGVNGRGVDLGLGFARLPGVEVGYLCDVDQRAPEKMLPKLATVQQSKPEVVSDFRRMLDDPHVDLIGIAAPNHWHAPAGILACSAGKHVYVEKPCSCTAEEGEWFVQAARKNNRVVTMGTQRRSRAPIIQAIEKVRGGEIGTVRYCRTWYHNRRGTIGIGKETSPPDWLDYELWQGPAPRRPFKDNLIHYNWHWHWHWGNGELGNNGVHALDLARWGLAVDYPTRVSSNGGRYRFDDDQETPDTNVVTLEFDERAITWEGISWSPRGPSGSSFGVSFHGDKGTLELLDTGYQIFDMQGKQVDTYSGTAGDEEHFTDFIRCIREGGSPTADIEEGHKSTLLCHLGNMAYRAGRSLHIDSANGHIRNDAEAESMWGREYAPQWQPKV